MTTISVDVRLGLQGSLAVKAPVRAATTAAITLSGTQAVDGVSLAVGDRVLVKDQASAIQNGIYDVASAAWTRAEDFNGTNDVVEGTMVHVNQGTANAATFWRVFTSDPISIGVTALSFEQIA